MGIAFPCPCCVVEYLGGRADCVSVVQAGTREGALGFYQNHLWNSHTPLLRSKNAPYRVCEVCFAILGPQSACVCDGEADESEEEEEEEADEDDDDDDVPRGLVTLLAGAGAGVAKALPLVLEGSSYIGAVRVLRLGCPLCTGFSKRLWGAASGDDVAANLLNHVRERHPDTHASLVSEWAGRAWFRAACPGVSPPPPWSRASRPACGWPSSTLCPRPRRPR